MNIAFLALITSCYTQEIAELETAIQSPHASVQEILNRLPAGQDELESMLKTGMQNLPTITNPLEMDDAHILLAITAYKMGDQEKAKELLRPVEERSVSPENQQLAKQLHDILGLNVSTA